MLKIIILSLLSVVVSAIPVHTNVPGSFIGLFEVENKNECGELQGDNMFETYRLRNECEMVYLNEYIQWSERMIHNNPSFVKDLPIVDVTGDKSDDDVAMPPLKDVLDRPKRSLLQQGPTECPVFNDDYLGTHKLTRDRSLSPWMFVINRNRNRIPELLIDTKCKCTGCIDMHTGTEDLNYVSVPLKIPVPVTNKLTKKKETTNINFGCTCIMPK